MTDKQRTVVVPRELCRDVLEYLMLGPKGAERVRDELCALLAAPVEQQGEPVGYLQTSDIDRILNTPQAVYGGALLSPHARDGFEPVFRHAQPPAKVDPDRLSNFIREIDGNHTFGAGRLAELIADHLNAPQR